MIGCHRSRSVLHNNDRLLAKFALLSYQDNAVYNEDDWYNLKSHANKETGFFGYAFINDNIKSIIVVFRGTDEDIVPTYNKPYKDWYDSNVCFFTGCIPLQYYDAYRFANDVFNLYKSFCFITVGHSLGGGLAQLVGIKYNIPAVTFDAPGTMLSANLMFNKDQVSQYKDSITAYVSAINAVNSAGKHLVLPMQILDESNIAYCSLPFDSFTMSQHRMEKILKRFDTETGNPKNAKAIDMNAIEWPGYNEFNKFCGETRLVEMSKLVNCSFVSLEEIQDKNLLKKKIIFKANEIKIERGFHILKKGYLCNEELSSNELLTDRHYNQQLAVTKNLEYDTIINDANISTFLNLERSERVSGNGKVEIFTVSVVWQLDSIDTQFYQARMQNELCDTYDCIIDVETSPLSDMYAHPETLTIDHQS